MSFIDKVKDLLGQHGDKVQQGLDKAAEVADQKTEGKYSDKISTAKDKAKEYVDKADESPNDKQG